MATNLASGLWQDPAVFAIRVIVAAVMGSAGLFIMIMGVLASQDGGPRSLWWCLWGFLLGAVGCLIGSVTALLWYSAALGGFLGLAGLIFLVSVLMDWDS